MKTKSIILAAGQGTRMKSSTSKVLHEIFHKPLVYYPIEAARYAGAQEVCLVVGHKSEEVMKTFGDTVKYALQAERLGTGHAVMQAMDFIGDDGEILVLYGDTPLITAQTIEKMLAFHRKKKNAVTVLSALVDDPTGYGRIVRDESKHFVKIVEQKDATDEEKRITEINGGMYVFEAKHLKSALSKITNNNKQQEYYLTDTIEILLHEGYNVDAIAIMNPDDILGVNSREQLAQATAIMKQRINRKHMDNGVTLIDPHHTYIDPEVEIGQDTVIEPGCIIEGNTSIGENCIIGYNTKIRNCTVGNSVDIESSMLIDSQIDEGCHIGPFAYIRPNSHIGAKVKIGDFVEIKNATIGEGTKVSHLTYIGDADVGCDVNFGCGTVVVNYDGEKKHRTTIKDHAFIGCNTNLVSPVVIEENVYTAAGSTITQDVPKNSLAIARARQEIKPEWVTKKRQK
ncbi:MAG: bifunctional UDP-N-acetylglucosamine diphosphorylase/glucosamine-1-phosphate N-acetyltransferase GlmU [Zhenhengia sp.]|uniref:bifunctional UDP-N-acetylglucosamine diphosphorylase/glucosamine-1-phosphate N-acetyltransferase GlmU n=1 Tax=Zhenhengia sp. TaxID=2944208 RepID=UPI0029073B70|nr:bifunctional UDP-N-acetylglucosamine diphosphorylase/glucosamine-1-phosphate N-acetyltransferase GlmU [Clostridiales bacterium]MDU6854192.1 bifunctional UDP-N-acetylglucosamine diphosphorylase/glucosamine-1-phosphate N-acetyltransferase GlmU [Clostridiales bacterium]MDU6973965.1 bifunctional UDP-N-acetylglucosamine diphosphorylase/glucosamine-1-phosphate N-acetyltransferase GlmU [Clostridiales bacterium]